MAKLIKTATVLEQGQLDALRRIAAEEDSSVARLIRAAITLFLRVRGHENTGSDVTEKAEVA